MISSAGAAGKAGGGGGASAGGTGDGDAANGFAAASGVAGLAEVPTCRNSQLQRAKTRRRIAPTLSCRNSNNHRSSR